ncbi:MAG: hypothetical protein WBP82_03740 [Leuconostoc mesenteroides]
MKESAYSGIINAMVNIKEELHRIELIRDKKRAFGSDYIKFGDYTLSFKFPEINKILNDKQKSLESELKDLANKLLKEDDTDVTS